MPVSEYYAGHGEEVLRNLIREYGKKKGTQIFYAMANKTGQKPKVKAKA